MLARNYGLTVPPYNDPEPAVTELTIKLPPFLVKVVPPSESVLVVRESVELASEVAPEVITVFVTLSVPDTETELVELMVSFGMCSDDVVFPAVTV